MHDFQYELIIILMIQLQKQHGKKTEEKWRETVVEHKLVYFYAALFLGPCDLFTSCLSNSLLLHVYRGNTATSTPICSFEI